MLVRCEIPIVRLLTSSHKVLSGYEFQFLTHICNSFCTRGSRISPTVAIGTITIMGMPIYFATIEHENVQVARVLRTACGPARNMTEKECLTFGCCWDPTHDELVPEHCYTQSGK